jgi:hypothetical protein
MVEVEFEEAKLRLHKLINGLTPDDLVDFSMGMTNIGRNKKRLVQYANIEINKDYFKNNKRGRYDE